MENYSVVMQTFPIYIGHNKYARRERGSDSSLSSMDLELYFSLTFLYKLCFLFFYFIVDFLFHNLYSVNFVK